MDDCGVGGLGCEDTSEALITFARENVERRSRHKDRVIGELSEPTLALYKAILFAELHDGRVFVIPNISFEHVSDKCRGLLLEHDFGFLGWNVPQLCEIMMQIRFKINASHDAHCEWSRTLWRGIHDSQYKEWNFNVTSTVQDMVHEQLVGMAQKL